MRNSLANRFGAGVIIVVIAVVVFIVYEQHSNPVESPPTASPTSPVSLLPIPGHTPQATKVPDRFLLLSAKAKLDAPIISVYFGANNTWDLSSLERNAGYLQGTPPIGVGGNHVIVGHVEMHDGTAGPFVYLNLLKAGDEILIVGTPTGITLRYVVTALKVVAPEDVAEMRNHGYEELTLVTCGDYDFKSNSYPSRLVVHARPIAALVSTHD